METTGFMCAPDTTPNVRITIITVKPKMMPRLKLVVTLSKPSRQPIQPRNMSVAVPKNSARNLETMINDVVLETEIKTRKW